MERVIDVAQYVYNKYKLIADEQIDELKLHKLLYYIQRESLAILNKPMFSENLIGWIHGPVSPEVRLKQDYFASHEKEQLRISNENAYIINNVLAEYAGLESWKLRNMTHEEISYNVSREGLRSNEYGCTVIELDNIRKDAEKVRPYDHVWDMYYDEFEDAL